MIASMSPPAIPALMLAAGLLAAPAHGAAAAQPHPSPDTVAALIAEAHDAQSHGDTQLALRLAQSAIVADPARPAAYVALGDVYAVAGQKEFARNYYDEALSIDPAEPSALKAIAALDDKTPRVIATP